MGDSPKWVKSRRRRKKEKKERGAKVGDNNGQATHGARKHAWRTQAAWANMKDFFTCLNKQCAKYGQQTSLSNFDTFEYSRFGFMS